MRIHIPCVIQGCDVFFFQGWKLVEIHSVSGLVSLIYVQSCYFPKVVKIWLFLGCNTYKTT